VSRHFLTEENQTHLSSVLRFTIMAALQTLAATREVFEAASYSKFPLFIFL